jgi:hypothetical protein
MPTEPIRWVYGLCDVTWNTHNFNQYKLSGEVTFNAIPKYQKIFGGKGNTVKGYLLESYDVNLSLSIDSETYNTLKLAIPHFDETVNGFYDNPSNVNMVGSPLVVHPYRSGVSKEYDITILSAYLDPEQPYERVYDKRKSTIELKFIGQPVERDYGQIQSYFFIGDWEAEGILNA